MKISSILVAAFLAEVVPTLAAPAQCSDKLVSVLKQYSSLASPFCSVYLNIPKKTTTTTKVATITPTPKTVTTKVKVTDTQTQTVYVTIPGDPVTRYYNAPFPSETKTILPTPPAKREATLEARDDLPSYVSGYAASAISSACSCLSVAPKTTTTTKSTTTTLPRQTQTVSKTKTVATSIVTTTVTVQGPRPTKYTCADYENSPLNKGYEYLNQGDVDKLTPISAIPIFSRDLIECCNLCYETENCVAYRFNNDHSTATCQRWTTPGGLPVVGYNSQCKAGIVHGTRQPILEKDFFGNMANPIAIGPCLDSYWQN
ncbi:hypothetical protein H2201_001492 [Coniosporium apollinis]|uniref:Apple domain-containing protein n=1 Tax=Coniosporium apollinis TaxID=61459 RepID=A0ABQ9P1G1_9PEZI|nr:hypothetical protein H2201_001492 [Coniosporium apollinis]